MAGVNEILSGAVVPLFLAVYAIYFYIKMKGRPMTKPRTVFRQLLKKGDGQGVSPIKAVIFALAGTLGVGNIVGVASAIALGGAGAVFWMWVSALLAMILKYAEVVLAMLHRKRALGEMHGGAMYYMEDHFNSRRKPLLAVVFPLVFTVLCLCNGFTMGCIIQSNAISESFDEVFGIDKVMVGVLIGVLCIVVFFLNGKRIFGLCERLVPLVSLLYVGMCLWVICLSYEKLPEVFTDIIKGAFDFSAMGGGVFGFLTSRALRYGTIRGLFSNEAGCGTSPIAHAKSSASSAPEQGFLGIAEVFIDTIVVCSMTALVILLNFEAATAYGGNPILMVFAAFEHSLGSVCRVPLAVSVFLFAFATIVCWGYYGEECVCFLNKSLILKKVYYIFYVLFVFFGSFISLDAVWEIADFAVGGMTVMNLYILGKMSREIADETRGYFGR